jgi:uncharacterized protein with von Willebrand factor type A (vWA) domain
LGIRKIDGEKKNASQGSKEYFEDIARTMRFDEKSPEAQRVGRSLTRAIKKDDVQYLEIRTPIGKDTQGKGIVSDIREFDISDPQ